MKDLKQKYDQLKQLESQLLRDQFIVIKYMLAKGLTKLRFPDCLLTLKPRKRVAFASTPKINYLLQELAKKRDIIEEANSAKLRALQVEVLKLEQQIEQTYKTPEIMALEAELAAELDNISDEPLVFFKLEIK